MTNNNQPTDSFAVTTKQHSIVITVDAFELAAILVQFGQELGAIPECFAPREDLRVMDTTWTNGSLEFVLAVEAS